MGIGGIVRSCVVEEDGGWMGAFKTVLIKSAFTSRRTGTKGKGRKGGTGVIWRGSGQWGRVRYRVSKTEHVAAACFADKS